MQSQWIEKGGNARRKYSAFALARKPLLTMSIGSVDSPSFFPWFMMDTLHSLRKKCLYVQIARVFFCGVNSPHTREMLLPGSDSGLTRPLDKAAHLYQDLCP